MQDADSQNEAGWQPIETSPLDVWVLLFFPKRFIGKWTGRILCGARISEKEWFTGLNPSTLRGAEITQPSHWMALPCAPDAMLSERMKDRS